MATKPAPNKPAAATGVESDKASVNWNDENMRTHFANVVNIQSTREQVDLFFGMNETWNLSGAKGKVNVDLNSRIVLTPLAAKRLSLALQGVLKEYEQRYGTLTL